MGRISVGGGGPPAPPPTVLPQPRTPGAVRAPGAGLRCPGTTAGAPRRCFEDTQHHAQALDYLRRPRYRVVNDPAIRWTRCWVVTFRSQRGFLRPVSCKQLLHELDSTESFFRGRRRAAHALKGFKAQSGTQQLPVLQISLIRGEDTF